MKHIFPILVGMLFIVSCQQQKSQHLGVRPMADTVGFAQYDWQTDSIMARIKALQIDLVYQTYLFDDPDPESGWKTVVCPHDDYAYAGYLYPEILRDVKASTVIIFGVAHKARQFELENRIVFDSYTSWHGPYGDIKISPIRDEIMNNLPEEVFIVHDSMQTIEHAVEALLPFLQYFNREVEIVSILVPYMSFDRMNEISEILAAAIQKTVSQRGWQWGKDYAIAISSDAVHYGDRDWGGKNFARFGTDKQGYLKAVAYEKEIISNCLMGKISPQKLERFTKYTVKANDYKQYKWTWCGRYSVPLGLLTSNYIAELQGTSFYGILSSYGTSIDHPKLKVEDLNMGITAPANDHHWVGYAAAGYK